MKYPKEIEAHSFEKGDGDHFFLSGEGWPEMFNKGSGFGLVFGDPLGGGGYGDGYGDGWAYGVYYPYSLVTR